MINGAYLSQGSLSGIQQDHMTGGLLCVSKCDTGASGASSSSGNPTPDSASPALIGCAGTKISEKKIEPISAITFRTKEASVLSPRTGPGVQKHVTEKDFDSGRWCKPSATSRQPLHHWKEDFGSRRLG
jgi:hypothetical protein